MISNTQNKQVYSCDGSTTQWPIPFPLLDTIDGTDLVLYLVNNSTGAVSLITSNYAVNTGTMQVQYPVSGSAQAVGYSLVLIRVEALTQELLLTNSGPTSLENIMLALDKLTMIVQQQAEQLSRCFMLPVNVVPASPLTPPPLPGGGGVLPFYTGTYAQLKAIAAADPAQEFEGFATDEEQLVFYTANTSVGDQGFIVVSG